MKIASTLFLLFLAALTAAAQTGVLIPLPKDKPDEKMLSIGAMNVEICVNNQTVNVKLVQIYQNQTAQTLEGKFVFALPETASVSDFAAWDGATRIPGVMMERRRANEIYAAITARQIDPGILQIDDTGGKTVFSARVFPIPAYGTKRVEIEYAQNLPLENFASHLTFPLKNSFGEPQTVGKFSLAVCAYSEFPFTSLSYDAQNFPLQVRTQTANEFVADFSAENFVLNHDFSLDYRVQTGASLLSLIAFRAPEQISAYELRNPALAKKNADGYFEMRAVFNEPTDEANRPPRRVVLLVDTSLSMIGEKLIRAVESAEFILRNLNPEDEFNLILFGSEPHVFSPEQLAASPENVEKALDFLKNSNLSGGTNLKKALEKSIEIAAGFAGEKSVILISDANPTRETINKKSILSIFDASPSPFKIFGLALGSDADTALFAELARRTDGFYIQARETEDVSAILRILLSKIGDRTFRNLNFLSDSADNFYEIYASGEHGFNGSSFSFVGRYRAAQTANINLKAFYSGREISLWKQVQLPEFADFNDHLPRLWAQRRIDWLVREMDLNGEREDFITEIIALSQKYKIVSPYTAFIAAPRALLRPRLIQPGDPVIRVKTDESITQVFAVLPFGETLPLKFLNSEGVWETRFLAPAWMADGTYHCRILLTDKNGAGFEETKSFVVDSNAPTVKITLPKTTFYGGEEIEIRVSADRDTAKLTAKLYGAKPAALYWSASEKANIGRIKVPRNIASGQYVLTVTAEDFARNQSSEEVRIEILEN